MIFTELFYKHIAFRKSCGVCHYTNTKRPSDITIADFWGWEKTDPEINKDDKGLSLVFINTDKGKKLWEAIQSDMNVIPAKLNDCMQPNLKQPSDIHPLRNKFEEYYVRHGFYKTMCRYCNYGIWNKIKSKLKKVLKLT